MARMRVPHTDTYTDKPTDKAPCQCCGKEVKSNWKYSVELDNDNRAIAKDLPERTLYRADSMGFYPIGTKCATWLKAQHPGFYDTYVHVG